MWVATARIIALLSFFLPAFPTVAPLIAVDELPPGGTFVDDDGDIHEGYIEAIALEAITKGCDPPLNISYCPQRPVTRGEMAAFLARALDLERVDEDAFTDDAGSIFEGDIDALAAVGVTKGCNPPDNDAYCPERPVTRGEMAAFLTRALDLERVDEDAFTDDAGSIFEGDIDALAAAGITKGCNPPDNNAYCPSAPVTRNQMASFLGRALGLEAMRPDPRPAVFDGVPWSIHLPDADHPEGTYGWTSASFYSRGIVLMDLRVYDTPEATIEERSLFVAEPEGGWWIPTALMPASPGEPQPIEFAASGDRVVATEYPPAVRIFTRVESGWEEELVSLASTIVDDRFDGEIAISGDRIVVLIDENRFVVVDWDGTRWITTVHATGAHIDAHTVDVDGEVIAFGASEAAFVATESGGNWTVTELSPVVAGHNFGSSVDVDGGRILVGANGGTPGPGTSGAIYLYTRQAGAWVGETVAVGSEGFGEDAQLSDDVIVCGGAHSDLDNPLWIFVENGGVWAGRKVGTGFDSWVGDLAVRDGLGVAIHHSGLLGPHTAVLFGID